MCVIGDSVLAAEKWMLTIEGSVHIQPEDLPDFPSAAAVLMACYYVFNLEYQEEAASTLEFIQRLAHHYSQWLVGSNNFKRFTTDNLQIKRAMPVPVMFCQMVN